MSRVRAFRSTALSALLAVLAGCVVVPPAPPPDIVRLQREQDRLHADPDVAANGGAELENADAAVSTLAANARTLGPEAYQQGIYIADKLLRIAEASARAREAEQRSQQLGLERDRLLASGARLTSPDVPSAGSSARDRLFAMQRRLAGSESRVDERGLVVRLAPFNFRSDGVGLTAVGEQSLASLAIVLNAEPAAAATVVARDTGRPGGRAATVRDYLDARGVDPSRLLVRDARDLAVGVAGDDVVVIVQE